MPEVFEIKNGVLKKYLGAQKRVVIPDGVTEIEEKAFEDCRDLSVRCSRGSCAWKYCRDRKIPVEAPRSSFFGRLFNK